MCKNVAINRAGIRGIL